MRTRTSPTSHVTGFVAMARRLLRTDHLCCYALVLMPNLLAISYFASQNRFTDPAPLIAYLHHDYGVSLAGYLLHWCLANALLVMLLVAFRRRVLLPLIRMCHHIHHAMMAIAQESPQRAPSLLNMRAVAAEVSRFTLLAQEYYRKHVETTRALEDARRALAQITLQQHNLMATTSREMVAQYQSVISYANYLEEHISATADDPSVRYGFDDVCESGFNLKIIAEALTLLRSDSPPAISSIPIAMMLQKTLLTLAPSLDRRSMKFSSAEVDVSIVAESCWNTLEHVLWMMILGTIRYAADESTLRMRCLYNRERTQVIVSVVISELSPGRLSPSERSAYLHQQLEQLTPHMFAETIRIHANLRLAELLLNRLDASISILPLTSHSCEICMLLPVGSPVADGV